MRTPATPAPTSTPGTATTIAPGGGRAVVPTGIAIAIPEGYAGFVLPRSGLALRHGITCLNTPGLIDAGYRDEVRVILVNTDPTSRTRCSEATGSRSSSSSGSRQFRRSTRRCDRARPTELSAGLRRLSASVRGAPAVGSPQLRSRERAKRFAQQMLCESLGWSVVTDAVLLDSLPSTRRTLLDTLKRRGEARVDELAEALGVTVSAVRQHLSAPAGRRLGPASRGARRPGPAAPPLPAESGG